jgi:RNA polymerase sigma-70 factor (ECF subfamily)
MLGQPILNDAVIMARATGDNVRELDVAVEETVRDYARFVFRLAYSVLRNHADAEDAAQEVFVRVLKHKNKLPAVRDRKVWLARIAWRVSLDWKSSSSSGLKHSENEADPAILLEVAAIGPSAENIVGSQQMKSLLEKMIATLPLDLREVVVLSTVQELNSSEIAEVLGIPEGSVRTRLMRARGLLKQKLAAAMEKQHV